MIYTSGSTGIPKGVMVNHVGMMNHLLAKISDLDYSYKDIVAQTATQVFDISIWQIFISLVNGGKEVIISQDNVLDIEVLVNIIKKEKISILELVPTQVE